MNKKKVLWIVLGALILVGTGFYMLNQPPSIEYLKEHPEEFQFEVFHDYKSFSNSVDQILSDGMSKSEVENIFVEHAGATVVLLGEENEKRFSYQKSTFSADVFCGPFSKGKPTWRFSVIYNSKLKLIRFTDKSVENSLFKAVWPCF